MEVSDSLSLHLRISANMCFSQSLVCVCAHSVSRLRVPMHVLTLRLCTRLKDGFSVISLSLGFTGKILREAEKQDSNRRRRGEKEQRVKDSVRVEQVSWWIYRTHCYCQYLSVYTEILFATPVCCSDSLLSLWSLLTAPPQRPTERERERPVEDEEVEI